MPQLIEGVVQKAFRISRRISIYDKRRRSTALQEDISESVVSDVSTTRGSGLTEQNALDDEGLYIVKRVAISLERRLDHVSRPNEDDAFYKERLPTVKLYDYLCRLARYVNVWRRHSGGISSAGVRAAVITLVYLERLTELQPWYVLNAHNIHRLAMTSFLVATKFTEDAPISNDYWAKVGGVKRSKVNALESNFCALLDFQLYVDVNHYAILLDELNMPKI